MAEIQSKEIYLRVKKRFRFKNKDFHEDFHCANIIDVMNTKGTMAAFCREELISAGTFYDWCKKFPIFYECYQIGKMISRANWELEGENGKDDENFDFEYWRLIGASRYGVGRTNCVRLDVDPESSPYEQYKQLIRQAGNAEFNASEIKQLMESINVGKSVYETFKLQERIDDMESNVQRMQLNNEHNSSPIEKVGKTD